LSATLEAPVAPPPIDVRTGRGIAQLARVEGRRFVRHPIFLGGVAVSLLNFFLDTGSSAPVLQRDDIRTGLWLLQLAGATFLVANLATTRSRRHGTDGLFDSFALGRHERTIAHLASVAYGVLVSAGLVALMMGYLLLHRAVGRPDVLELSTGPAIVMLAGVVGVAAGRWWQQAASGPVLLVALAGTQLYLQLQLSGSGAGTGKPGRWLAPWVPISVSGDPARELVVRSAGWHLLYVAALAGAAAGVAILRNSPRVKTVAILAVGVALAVVAAGVQVRETRRAERAPLADLLLHPEAHQVCQIREGVKYCAFPGYAGWIARWAGAIEPLLSRLPPDARPEGLEVRQTLVLWGSDVEDFGNFPPANTGCQLSCSPETDDLGAALRPSSHWGQGAEEGRYQLGLAILVATSAVGLPRRPQDMRLTEADIQKIAGTLYLDERASFLETTKPGDPVFFCSSLGQARAVVAMWLAASATPGTRHAFLRGIEQDKPLHEQGPATSVGPYSYAADDSLSSMSVFFFSPRFGLPEQTYAAEMLQQPTDQVARTIRANWNVLTDPATPSDELARLFGLNELPSRVEEEAAFDPAVIPCR
jgi:hypothetical protein